MIFHTTATLSGKLGKALKVKRVVLAPVNQVLGKLQEREQSDKLPAIAVDRKGLSINRENVIRSVAARKGFPISNQNNEVKFLHCLPVKVNYEIGVFTGDRDLLDIAENNLLWFLEEQGGDIDVEVELASARFTLPVQISPTILTDSFEIEREEEWEKSRLFKMMFSLEVKTFLLRSTLKPTILKVNYQIVNENEVLVI